MTSTTIGGPVKRASFSVTADGEIVAAVTGKVLRILALCVSTSAAAEWQIDDGDDTKMLGPFPVMSNAPWVLPFFEYGWADTGSGKSIKANEIGGTATFAGQIIYTEIG